MSPMSVSVFVSATVLEVGEVRATGTRADLGS